MPKFDDDTEDEDSDIYLWLDYQDGEISEEEFQRRMYGGDPYYAPEASMYDDLCASDCAAREVHSLFVDKYRKYIQKTLSHLDEEIRKKMPSYFLKENEGDGCPVFYDDESINKGVNDGLGLIYKSLCDYLLYRIIKNKIHNLPTLTKDYEYAFDYTSYNKAYGAHSKIEDFFIEKKVTPTNTTEDDDIPF